jgi:hypothetical protein
MGNKALEKKQDLAFIFTVSGVVFYDDLIVDRDDFVPALEEDIRVGADFLGCWQRA